jgi:hypothetical protein
MQAAQSSIVGDIREKGKPWQLPVQNEGNNEKGLRNRG